ncbi:MAG: hypothetical protein U5J95_09625 [Balneolaceae bacterium]|nr:hypothetical protein [Balneolaceae bacterium]
MITRNTILELINRADNPSISIYLPTHKKGKEVQQDPIRLKNLLKKAEEQLQEYEVPPSEIEELLRDTRQLLDKPSFWRHNDKGLAIFITKNDFEYYRVPIEFSEQVLVEDHFLITPLLPMITLDGTYCILALSQKEVKLLRCTRESVTPIELEDMPTSLEEFLKFDVNESHLQHHSGQGKGQAIFHGQGGSNETDTEEIVNFFKRIENEVTVKLRNLNDPLILAGVNEAIAIYKKVNHYGRLMENTIDSNPDPLSDDEINQEGWKIIKSYFLKDMYSDIDRFGDLTGSDKHSDNLTHIVEASYYGKVDSLFVPIGEQSWGWFDQERDTVHHSSKQQAGEHDLINMAAIKTMSQGGNVYALDKQEMPNGSFVAAIFRY